jgi:hypothetical protein
MQIFAQDLNTPTNQPSTSLNSTNSPGGDFSFSSFSLGQSLDLGVIIDSVNYFVLATSILYSFVMVINFFEYRIYFGGGELSNEKNGVDSLVLAIQLWWRYIFCLVFYVLFGLFRESIFAIFLAFLVIFVYAAKLFIDLIAVLSILNYFEWSSDWSNVLKNLIKFKK